MMMGRVDAWVLDLAMLGREPRSESDNDGLEQDPDFDDLEELVERDFGTDVFTVNDKGDDDAEEVREEEEEEDAEGVEEEREEEDAVSLKTRCKYW